MGLLVRRAHPEDLDEVRVREAVEEAAPGGVAQPDEVAPPRLADRELVHEPRLLVDRKAVDEVHRAEHVVPRIRLHHPRAPRLASGAGVPLPPPPGPGPPPPRPPGSPPRGPPSHTAA